MSGFVSAGNDPLVVPVAVIEEIRCRAVEGVIKLQEPVHGRGQFSLLLPRSDNVFFHKLRDEELVGFRSELILLNRALPRLRPRNDAPN